MMQIASMGDTQVELVLLTLRTLPEEILVYNTDLVDTRRRDILDGMRAALNTVFPFFCQVLGSQVELYRSALAAITQPGAPEAAEKAKRLTLAAIQAVEPFVPLVNMEYLLENNLALCLCHAMAFPEMQLVAAECLLLIVSEKNKTSPKHVPMLLAVIDQLSSVCASIASFSEDDEIYTFHKKLCQILTMLGINNIDVMELYKPQHHPSLGKFVHMLLAFGNHPSVLITSFLLPFWVTLLSQEKYAKLPFLAPVFPQLLTLCEQKVMKLGDPETAGPAADFSRLDFDDKSEYLQFFAVIRAKVADLVRLMSEHVPALTFDHLAKCFHAALTTDHSAEGAFTTKNSYYFIRLEGAAQMLEFMLLALPAAAYDGSDPAVPNFQQALQQLLTFLFDFATVDPLIIERQLHVIAAFTRYFAANPSVIPYVLQKVMSYASFRSEMADDVSARRQATVTLISICKNLAAHMLPYLSELMSNVQQLYSQQLIRDTELTALTEPLIIISNEMKQYDQQVNFLSQMMSNVEADWVSQTVQLAVSDPICMLQCLGFLGEQGQPTLPQAQNVALRNQIYRACTTFFIAARRCQAPTDPKEIEQGNFGPYIVLGVSYSARNPFQAHLPTILPTLINLIRCLHAMWEPRTAQMLGPQMAAMFSMSDVEVNQIVGVDDTNEDTFDESNEVSVMRRWLTNVRDTCYRILARAAENGDDFYSFDKLDTLMLAGPFSSLEYMEPRHLRLLLKVPVASFVNNCPPALYAKLLDPVLPALFSFIGSRLDVLWQELSSCALTGASSTKAEIVRDKVLRELTREYAELLLASMQPRKGETSPDGLSDLGRHIVRSAALLQPFIYGLLACMAWPDSLCCRKAIQGCTSLVPFAAEDHRFHALVGSDMLAAALRALSQKYTQTLQAELVELVRAIYVKLSRVISSPRDVLRTLPNMTEQQLDDFDNRMAASGDPKKQRIHTRKLLQDVLGMSVSTYQRGGTILDLPEKLFIIQASKPSATAWQDAETDLGMSSMFSSPSK
eukprot:TRINITY_DN9443_c0_g1_i2.p1 TRINITY_DN9443_c0_g1~~TRINITY_DN9443_c0_g1_i2.p1  ORF type:complete len:1017 (-),score=242.53 TRINITY_DN9443_c0_g1_i2:19-3069(-)